MKKKKDSLCWMVSSKHKCDNKNYLSHLKREKMQMFRFEFDTRDCFNVCLSRRRASIEKWIRTSFSSLIDEKMMIDWWWRLSEKRICRFSSRSLPLDRIFISNSSSMKNTRRENFELKWFSTNNIFIKSMNFVWQLFGWLTNNRFKLNEHEIYLISFV